MKHACKHKETINIFVDFSCYFNTNNVFHSIISPPLAKNCDNKIIFLHSIAAEEICSADTVANFSASGGDMREWKTALM